MDSVTRRATGSYYTSADTAQYMADWLVSEKHLNVLEPTAGDGIFIDSLMVCAKLHNLTLNITAVELEKRHLNRLKVEKRLKLFTLTSIYLTPHQWTQS